MPHDFEALTDEQLVERSRAGDMVAFEELVSRFETRIYRFALHSCRRPEDAAEITQDTFVRAWRAFDRFDGSRTLAPWLFAIARRLCIDHHRRRPEPTEVLSEQPEIAAEPGAEVAHDGESDVIWNCARSVLSPNQFHALWLRYAEDMDVVGIARALGLTRTHVKVLLFRARKSLARQLSPHAGHNPKSYENLAEHFCRI